MTTPEAAKKVRALLRVAFPLIKISVTTYFSAVKVAWGDDTGVSLDAVKAVLAAVPFVRTNGAHYYADDYYVQFDCHNIAEREADLLDRERRKQDRRHQQQELDELEESRLEELQEAIDQALEAKGLPPEPPPPPQETDASVFAAFDRLRERAELEANFSEDSTRRPSWAPPLLLGEELGELCLEYGYITLDDLWIARLWANFASPERKTKFFRHNVSQHPLHGITCRGFQLFAGSTRRSASMLLFEAQREESGEWRFGPQYEPLEYVSVRYHEWHDLVCERDRLQKEAAPSADRLAEITARIAAIDAQDVVDAGEYYGRPQPKLRMYELARARVLEFIGAPDAQMAMASRLWGHCCNCGKVLTDTQSLERGIGPDCYERRIGLVRRYLDDERLLNTLGVPAELADAVRGSPCRL
jgi:hypothetical protein